MSLRKLFAIVALAACCALFGLSGAQAGVKSFTITAGPMGGDWYSIGGAMGEMAKQVYPGAIVTVTTGGSLANIAKVNAGKADVGLSMAKLYAEALAGKGKYKGKKMENLRAVAFLAYIPMSYFLVKADNPLASIEQIKAKKMPIRLLTSKKGSSPSLAAELMLAQYGITFNDIKEWGGSVSFVSYAEASNLIKDGHADAWVGPMVSSIVELTTTTKMKQLPIKPAYLDKLKKDFNYAEVMLPKGKYYFVTKDTPQMAEAVIVITQKKLGTDEVYKFTSALMKDAARIQGIHKTYSGFNPATAWQNVGGPLHPGALKYYKEKGYLK